MVYKKYIKRGEKIYGPYKYHSRKVNGKVITDYLGKHVEKNPKNRFLVFLIIGLIAVISLILIWSYNPDLVKNLTGFAVSEGENASTTVIEEDPLAFISFVIELTKAEHLDLNRNFISDIYDQVKKLDDIWSKTISDNEYVRVTFEENLTSESDITIYPKIVDGTPRVEVYEFEKSEVIAEFKDIISNQYNKVLLTNLQGSQNIFDLLILGGSLQFDHIVDPTSECSATVCNVTFFTSETWEVPTGVTEITGLVIGGGGGGMGSVSAGSGGSGGALRYSSAITVISEETLTIIVGSGGVGSGTPSKGGFSNISSAISGTLLMAAGGGQGTTGGEPGANNGTSTAIGGVISGGDGGIGGATTGQTGDCGGGGGAGGYNGDGGAGGDANANGAASTGGGGGGGGSGGANDAAGGGGGVNISSARANGTGGNAVANDDGWSGTGGSGGLPVSTTQANTGTPIGQTGGKYGGGGGGSDRGGIEMGDGGDGIVVITYVIPPTDEEFPQFTNYWSNNATIQGSGTAKFNVTIINTNGTAGLEIGGSNYSAHNTTADEFNTTVSSLSEGTYSYYWWGYGNGSQKNYNTSQIQYYTVNASPPDLEFPIFSDYKENPDNNTVYSFGATYRFNSTITSVNGTAGLDFNSFNYSAHNTTASLFNRTITNLGAGTYSYYWWAYGNGSQENYNTSGGRSYTIAKATPTLSGSVSASITYGSASDYTGSESDSGDDDCVYSLKREGVEIDTGSSVGDTDVLGAGTWNYNYSTAGCVNYSAGSDYDTLVVTKTVPTGSISTGTSPIIYGTVGDVEGTESNTGDDDVQYKLYRDNVSVSNPDTTILGVGSYHYIYNATAGVNWTDNASIDEFILINSYLSTTS
jgi:hypothetical protein